MFVLVIISPTIYFGLLCERANEAYDVKRHVQKNIQNKAVQTKLNLYIKKIQEKRNLINILI